MLTQDDISDDLCKVRYILLAFQKVAVFGKEATIKLTTSSES